MRLYLRISAVLMTLMLLVLFGLIALMSTSATVPGWVHWTMFAIMLNTAFALVLGFLYYRKDF
jgi:hypothetical protein